MGFLPGATRPNKKDLKRGKVKIKAGVERVPVHLCPPPIRAQVQVLPTRKPIQAPGPISLTREADNKSKRNYSPAACGRRPQTQ